MNNNSKAVLLSLCAAVGVAMAGLGVIWPILPVLATQMGVGGLVVGIIIASFNVSRTVFSQFVGRLSDRFGRKNFILLGLFLYALISFGYLYAHTPAALIAVRLAHGFASLLVVPIALALAGDIAPPDQLGAYMGTLNMAVMTGLGFGPSLSGFLQEQYGMDAAFYCMGMSAVLIGLIIAIVLPPDKESGAVRRREGTASLKTIFTNRTMLAVIFMRFFAASGQGAVYTFLPIYAMQIGMPESQLGIILSVNIFLIALMQRPVGRWVDRSNPKYALIVGMFLSSITVFPMPFVDGFYLLLALNFLMGAANGFIFPGGLVVAGQLGRVMGMATIMSVNDAAWSLGMIVSPILSGIIMDVWGIHRVFVVGSIMIGIGSLAVTYLLRDYDPDAPAVASENVAVVPPHKVAHN